MEIEKKKKCLLFWFKVAAGYYSLFVIFQTDLLTHLSSTNNVLALLMC